MPIEIRELVIKATVEITGANNSTTTDKIEGPNVDFQKLAEEIIKNIETSNER